MKNTCCLWAILCLFANEVSGQKFQPLNVGDQVPAMIIKNIVNSPNRTYYLSAAKDKLILIDFFATWCGPCVSLLPHLDSLRRAFGDSLDILVVSYENAKVISSFLAKNKSAGKLPFATDDSLLRKRFPYRSMPHEVWIYKGVVRAITAPKEVTAENIRKVVTGKSINLPLKKDLMEYDVKLAFQDNEVFKENARLLTSSLFTSYMDGIGAMAGSINDSAKGLRRFYYINMSPYSLYRSAVGDTIPLPNRWVIELADRAQLKSPESNKEWTRKNALCYELTLPWETPISERNRIMLSDLDRQLGLRSYVENRLIDSWVIYRTGNPTFQSSTVVSKQLITIKDFVYRLNQPVLDAAVFSTQLSDVDFPERPPSGLAKDIDVLKRFLEKYGLGLRKEKVSLPVFVITDNHLTQKQN